MTSFNNVAAQCARITTWYASLPKPITRSFTPAQLVAALNSPMQQLYAPLMFLKWQRHQIWHRVNGRRILRVYYTSPSQVITRPKRGRPPVDIRKLLGITT